MISKLPMPSCLRNILMLRDSIIIVEIVKETHTKSFSKWNERSKFARLAKNLTTFSRRKCSCTKWLIWLWGDALYPMSMTPFLVNCSQVHHHLEPSSFLWDTTKLNTNAIASLNSKSVMSLESFLINHRINDLWMKDFTIYKLPF
jgi:hypothetical protein